MHRVTALLQGRPHNLCLIIIYSISLLAIGHHLCKVKNGIILQLELYPSSIST
jgi:hypothetical protein